MLPIALYLFHHVKLPCTYTLPILSRIFIHFSTCKEIEKKKKEREKTLKTTIRTLCKRKKKKKKIEIIQNSCSFDSYFDCNSILKFLIRFCEFAESKNESFNRTAIIVKRD